MASQTAQDEFNALFNKSSYSTGKAHPEDAHSHSRSSSTPIPSRTPSPAQSFLNLDDDDEDDDNTAADLAVKAMRGTYYLPRATRQANTGPKGVIADAQAFEQAKRQAASVRSVQRRSYIDHRASVATRVEEEQRSSEEDEEDERFLDSWRQKRLVELAQLRGQNTALGRSGSGKVMGELRKVDAEGFLNAVDGAPEGTVVIVLIYDSASEISNLVEDAVRTMARTHTSTRFIKLHYAEAEFEPAGVPALLAYRNGDKFAGFVPISDEIPDNEELSARSLTALLQRHQVL